MSSLTITGVRAARLALCVGLVVVIGILFAGCVAGGDAAPKELTVAPEGRVICHNMQLDVPEGWTLQPAGAARWQLVPPAASSYAGWVVCTDGGYPSATLEAHERENAAHLGWADKLRADSGARVTMVFLNSQPLTQMPPLGIPCRQAKLEEAHFETCAWFDPYPRREQRGDGYLGQRWSATDPVAVAQRAELAASITRSFLIRSTPESSDDQHP